MTKQASYIAVLNIRVFFLSCILMGCNRENNKRLDQQVFRYNEHKNISSLDPAFSKDKANVWAVHQLFNGLVELDKNMQIQPLWHLNQLLSLF